VATLFVSNGDLQWQQTKSDQQLLSFEADSLTLLDDYDAKSSVVVPDGFLQVPPLHSLGTSPKRAHPLTQALSATHQITMGDSDCKGFKLQLYPSEVSTKEGALIEGSLVGVESGHHHAASHDDHRL